MLEDKMKFAKLIQIDSAQVGSKKVSRSRSNKSKTDIEEVNPKIRLAVKGDIDSTLESGIGSQHMENDNMDKARNARFARLREAAGRALAALPSRNVGSRFSLGRVGGDLKKIVATEGLELSQRVGGMIAGNLLGGALATLMPAGWEAGTKQGVKSLLSLGLGAAALAGAGYAKGGMLKKGLAGAADLYTLGFLFNGLSWLLPGNSLISGLQQNALLSVQGRRSVGALFSADELKAKLDSLDAEAGQLSGVVDQIDASQLSDSQHAVYLSAVEHIAAVKGPTGAARRMLDKGGMDSAVDAAKDSQHLIDVGRALLAGLTAEKGGMGQMASPVPTPEMVAIKDAATGEVKQIPAMSDAQVAQQTTSGLALNLDMIYPWSQWVASVNPGWSPAEVSTAFILKWLANNGHLFAYGPNQVTAYSNWAPGNINGASQGGSRGVSLTTSGQMYVSGFSPEEVYATVSGIYERHFGSM